MIAIFLNLIWHLAMGLAWRMMDAVEALEKPANNDEAQRYRTAAVVCLFLALPFTTAAAIVFNIAPKKELLFNLLGFTGLGFVAASLICGLVYGRVNAIVDAQPTYGKTGER